MAMGLQERKAVIRQHLSEAQAGLDAALDRIGADGWAQTTRNEQWVVRDLLAHLATAESGFVRTLARMAAGEGGVPADFDIDRWNAAQLRRQNDSPWEHLRVTLLAAHGEMLALLDRLDDSALNQRGKMSSGGEGSVEDTFRLVANHKRAHTVDIESARVR